MAIEARGQFLLTDVWSGYRLVARDWLLVCSLLGGMLVGYATLGFILDPKGMANHVVVMVVGLLIPLYVWLAAFNRSRRMLAQTPSLNGTVRYEFDKDGFRSAATHSTSETQWDAILKWGEGKTVLLLYRSPSIAEIIPKRFFQDSSDLAFVRSLLTTHVPS